MRWVKVEGRPDLQSDRFERGTGGGSTLPIFLRSPGQQFTTHGLQLPFHLGVTDKVHLSELVDEPD
jgi:hypothetical protein